MKIGGSQVPKELAAICQLKTAAGIFIGEFLPQMLDPRDLLGGGIEPKSVWVLLRCKVPVQPFELFCIVRRIYPPFSVSLA